MARRTLTACRELDFFAIAEEKITEHVFRGTFHRWFTGPLRHNFHMLTASLARTEIGVSVCPTDPSYIRRTRTDLTELVLANLARITIYIGRTFGLRTVTSDRRFTAFR